MSKTAEIDSFYQLDPNAVLEAIESLGYETNGVLSPLNSYENRVYEIGLCDEAPLIAKFYRPARWSDAAIIEEHEFTLELEALEIPVVAPLQEENGTTLHTSNSFRFALYPKRAGRAPDLDDEATLTQLGRFIGRIHALGAESDFEHRPQLTVAHFGDESCDYLLEEGFIPPELESAYAALTEDLLDEVDEQFFRTGRYQRIRLHGDTHPGNILWFDGCPQIVDFDDARMGPAVQDLWMFVSGEREHREQQLDALLEGYNQFFDFNVRELALIEGLRTLRMMHHAAWMARRWDDPAFKYAFPWFNSQNYWQDHILALKEQASALHEHPLQWRSRV